MSDIVKEKPLMEEVQKRYNNFIKSKLMMSEYEKKEIYSYDKQILLDEERKLGKKEEQLNIARNLKKLGLDIELIKKSTGLSIEEIEKL